MFLFVFCVCVCVCVCDSNTRCPCIFHVSDPRVSVPLCGHLLLSVFHFLHFIKIPRLPSTGQDTQLLPSNPHPRPLPSISSLPLCFSVQARKCRQTDFRANAHTKIHKYRSTRYIDWFAKEEEVNKPSIWCTIE